MQHKDAEMSDIYVVSDDPDPARLDALANTLKTLGCIIESIDRDNAVIEGTAPNDKVKQIEHLPGIKYVRSVFNYVAETPESNASDKDEDEEIPR
jgi:hypothetical protein